MPNFQGTSKAQSQGTAVATVTEGGEPPPVADYTTYTVVGRFTNTSGTTYTVVGDFKVTVG